MTSPTSAPAPLAYTPYEYTPTGRAEAWVREKMEQRYDFQGAIERQGIKKATQMMREEGN